MHASPPNPPDDPICSRGLRCQPLRLWHNLAAVAATIVLAIILLLVTTHARVTDLKAQDEKLVSLTVAGTTKEIENTIFNARRMLNLFAENESDLLAAIAQNPHDEVLFSELQQRVHTVFPDAFAVTIADRHGDPLIVDFAGLVQEVCQADIRDFAEDLTPPPLFIHPNPEGYHIDLMVRLNAGPEPVIFFVSFRPDIFSRALTTRSMPNHELVMINTAREGLIEITERGSRDQMSRAMFLSEAELTTITHQQIIAGTQWRLVALPKPRTAQTVYWRIWTTASGVVAVLLIVGSLAIYQLVRAEQRTQAQNNLLRAVSRAESRFIAEGDINAVFQTVLDDLLALTGSEYGLIGEILQKDDGEPYLRSYAITDIAWDDVAREQRDEHAAAGYEIHALDTQIGDVICQGREVIDNHPDEHTRRSGLPPGHPSLRSLAGIPLYHGPHFVGMIGLANGLRGYDSSVVERIRPILRSSANLLWALKTDRQRLAVESALRESSTRHRTILNTVSDGIITLNEDGLIESFNPAAERIFGYRSFDIIGRSLSLLLDDTYLHDQGKRLLSDLKTHSRSLSAAPQEAVARREDGNTFPAEISISETPLENQRLYTCIVRDITQRKQAQHELMRTTSLQRAILDSANYTIISTDANGIIQTFNAGAERMLGYRAAEVVGQRTPGLFHDPEEVAARSRELSEALNTPIEPGFEAFVAKARHGEIDEREWTYIRKDGSRFPVLLSITALRDDTGELTGFLGIGSDITERKRIDRMKSEFVSTVSHELRTPLTAIRGSLGLISGGAIGDVPQRALELVDIAAGNSERLVRLINDILDIEKIESGRMEFRLEAQPLLPIIQRSLAANTSYAEQLGITLELDPAADGWVNADPDRLTQVVDNLLSNAIKFSGPGDRVSVTVTRRDDLLRVSVRDHGTGIPPEFRSQLFSKFAQADASDSRQRGGTGLGLAISRSIIEMHHGIMGYESTLGEGSEFYFDLPVVEAGAPVIHGTGEAAVHP